MPRLFCPHTRTTMNHSNNNEKITTTGVTHKSSELRRIHKDKMSSGQGRNGWQWLWQWQEEIGDRDLIPQHFQLFPNVFVLRFYLLYPGLSNMSVYILLLFIHRDGEGSSSEITQSSIKYRIYLAICICSYIVSSDAQPSDPRPRKDVWNFQGIFTEAKGERGVALIALAFSEVGIGLISEIPVFNKNGTLIRPNSRRTRPSGISISQTMEWAGH